MAILMNNTLNLSGARYSLCNNKYEVPLYIKPVVHIEVSVYMFGVLMYVTVDLCTRHPGQ